MATDFLHTSELIEAARSVLKGASGTSHVGGLPANWFTDGDDDKETVLVSIQHGDFRDIATDEQVEDLLPAVYIRSLGVQGMDVYDGGVSETYERFRLVHARRRDQTHTYGAVTLDGNISRAKERYSKIIVKALFNDPRKRLAVITAAGARTEVSLTCADASGAQVVSHTFTGLDYGGGTEDTRMVERHIPRAWAVAIDYGVLVRSG